MGDYEMRDDIQSLVITQLRDVNQTVIHLAEHVAGIEVKVTTVNGKVDDVLSKLDDVVDRYDRRLSVLESFKWKAQGTIGAIVFIWAPLMAWIGWTYRGIGPVAPAVTKVFALVFHY